MCKDSLTPNMRKDVEEIVSKKMREQISEEVNQSSVDLLKEIVDETKKQNELLSDSINSSNKVNDALIVFAGITLITAIGSFQIIALEKNIWVFVLVYAFIFSIFFLFWQKRYKVSTKNNKSKITNSQSIGKYSLFISKVVLLSVLFFVFFISSPIIIKILLPELSSPVVMVLSVISDLVVLGLFAYIHRSHYIN